MNAIFANQTFPLAARRYDRPHRRHRVGQYALPSRGVAEFNRLLERLQVAPVDDDQLATFGRSLSHDPAQATVPPWISARMRSGAAVRLMLGDPGWEPLDVVTGTARLVSGYLRDHDDLIPDNLPVLGRLDDAIVVEAAWPQVGAEVFDYLDYRRLRRIEAELRGCDEAAFRFGRYEWEMARRAEVALLRHVREVGCRSYLPASGGSSRFQVN